MTPRERFIKTLTFDNPDRVFYHFGNPRESTMNSWYLQGLPRMSNAEFYDFVGMDRLDWAAPVNTRLVPPFETRIIEENEKGRIWMDGMGIVMHDAGKLLKTPGFNTRSYLSHPVKNRDDWPAMRERFDPHSPERFPDDWDEKADALRQRDWPVMMALAGLYWRTRDWLGFENLSTMFYDDPELVHEMMEHITIFIMEIVRKVHQDIQLDCLMLNEDMAYKHASMISMFMGISYAEIWYEENFDDFDDGDVAGQDEWETVFDQESATIQGDVAFGNTGKSLLVEGSTMVIRNFPDAHADIQHVSFHRRKDSSVGWQQYFIGGDGVEWSAAVVIKTRPVENALIANNGGQEPTIAEITLGEWSYFHVVLDFNSGTWDLYVDGDQIVDDFAFRGTLAENPSLDWFFFGRNAPEDLVAYVDNISIGTGEGDPNPPRMAVSSSSKLATTWAELKESVAK